MLSFAQLILSCRPKSFLVLVGCALTFALTGCATGAGSANPEDSGKRELTRKAPEDRLFDAIVKEVAARGWSVDVESAKHRILSTEYESISARLRKRRVLRVILLPQGGALNVQVQYQRDTGPESQPMWVAVEKGSVFEKAKKEELELARSVEKRFHQM